MQTALQAAAILLMLLPISAPAAETFSGKVVGITDGDTITVLRDGKPEKIRLVGIDCPESGQAFGNKAKQFTSDRCMGQPVTVAWSKRDRYGRILGTVMVGQTNVNRELLKAGLAWQFIKYDKSKELGELEAAARKDKVGLWSDAAPVAPWDWRQAEADRKKQNPKRPIRASPAKRG